MSQEEAVPQEPDDSSTGSAVAQLRLVRPAEDPLAMEDVRARAERALFGAAEPARLGRYVLLGRIAGGGMGVVYGAYDPDLNRKVALKVLHREHGDTERGHPRLISEARALAKLDHPNVVKVHDVITHAGQVVVVMVLVEGLTLADWLAAAPRSSKEILAAYRQAGEGLAAAHDVGVIHRDFKPANAILGHNGRVQVLDFGLARVADGAPVAPSPELESLLALDGPTLSVTGEAAGTLGYMAPEQLAGEPATPASDQFSFCVALHRAIEGVPPFTGSDPAALRARITRGVIEYARDGRSVPKWLRGVLARGLAASARARFPSMRALLGELGRERGWRRWRRPGGVLIVAAAAGVAVSMLRGPSEQLAPCDGGAVELATVWGSAQRVQLLARLRAIATPLGRELEDRIPAQLDDYARSLREAQREGCQAYRRGAQSAELFDRRTLCLERHRTDLSAAIQVLRQVDARSATSATQVIAGMSPVDDCADSEALSAASPPPATLGAKVEVAAVRAQLGHAAALDRIGRDQEALAVVRQARALAERTRHAPAIVEAALREGQILLFSHDGKAAIAPLALAESLALEHRMYPAAVEAAARRLFCEGIEGAPLAALEPRIAVMDAIGRGLRGDHFAWPLLLNSTGVIYIASGQREPAARYFMAARAALNGVAHPDLELIAIDKNLAMVTADRAEREALSRNAWERLDRELGAAHPLTVEALEDRARYLLDPSPAGDLMRRACQLYAQYYAAQVRRRAVCLSHLAFLASERGDRGASTALYREVGALTAGITAGDVGVMAQLAEGELRLAEGRPAAAIGALSPVVDRLGRSDEWWERRWVAQALLGIGQAWHALGQDDRAVASLERACATYAELTRITEQVENHQRLAQARAALAAVLQRLGREPERAGALAEDARTFYLAAGQATYRWRLADPSADRPTPAGGSRR